jgi:hypothetical protein
MRSTFKVFFFVALLGHFSDEFLVHSQVQDQVPCQQAQSSHGRIRSFFAGLYQALRPSDSTRISMVKDQTPRELGQLAEFSQERLSNPRSLQLGHLIYQRLNNIGPQYPLLVGDPSIVDKLDQFEKFASETEKENDRMSKLIQQFLWVGNDSAFPEGPYDTTFTKRDLDPFNVRKAFSDKLGVTTIYRALALSSEELEKIKSKGMDSSFIRATQNDENHFRNPQEPKPHFSIPQVGQIDKRPWLHLLERRIHGWNPGRDPFLSVTKNPDVAVYVAGRYTTNTMGKIDPSKGVYLFKLNIPALDIIEGRPSYTNPHHPFAVSGIVYHPDVESFTTYHVAPSQIEEIRGPYPANHKTTFDPENEVRLHPDLEKQK